MESILTLAQQQANKPISEKNAAKFNQLREETIRKDLTDLLGAALIDAIVKSPTESRFVNLLDAKEYEDSSGYTRRHLGLRFVLSYFLYARYIGMSDVADTYTGLVRKNRTESESLSDGRVKMLQNDARDIALTQFNSIKEYMTENITEYPEWHCDTNRKTFKPQVTTLRKTLR